MAETPTAYSAEETDRLREVLFRWGRVLVAKGDLTVAEFVEAWNGPEDVKMLVTLPRSKWQELVDLEAFHRKIPVL